MSLVNCLVGPTRAVAGRGFRLTESGDWLTDLWPPPLKQSSSRRTTECHCIFPHPTTHPLLWLRKLHTYYTLPLSTPLHQSLHLPCLCYEPMIFLLLSPVVPRVTLRSVVNSLRLKYLVRISIFSTALCSSSPNPCQ